MVAVATNCLNGNAEIIMYFRHYATLIELLYMIAVVSAKKLQCNCTVILRSLLVLQLSGVVRGGLRLACIRAEAWYRLRGGEPRPMRSSHSSPQRGDGPLRKIKTIP